MLSGGDGCTCCQEVTGVSQIETTFLDFLHPLIWLSVNHVSLSNLSCQLSNMLTFATIHFDTILCHTLFSPTICMYCMYCMYCI